MSACIAFPWGHIISKHQIEFGPERVMSYTKYHPWNRGNDGRVLYGRPTTEVQYHCEELMRSDSSLERLVVHWIADKNLGLNQWSLVDGIVRALNIK